MTKTISILFCLAIFLLTGLVHGTMTGRWSSAGDDPGLAQKLDQIPRLIGDYECKDHEMAVKPQDRVSAQMLRRYVNPTTGASLSIWIAAGPPGPLCIHTPDWCYPASGYDVVSGKTRFTLTHEGNEKSAQFWTAHFTRAKPTGTDNLQVFWAWNTGNGWEAAESPRFSYARASRLFKLYIVCSHDSRKDFTDDAPTIDFLQRLMPELAQFIE